MSSEEASAKEGGAAGGGGAGNDGEEGKRGGSNNPIPRKFHTGGTGMPSDALDYQARIADKIARENSNAASAAAAAADAAAGGSTGSNKGNTPQAADNINNNNDNNADSGTAPSSPSGPPPNSRPGRTPSARLALKLSLDSTNVTNQAEDGENTTSSGERVPSRHISATPSSRLAAKIRGASASDGQKEGETSRQDYADEEVSAQDIDKEKVKKSISSEAIASAADERAEKELAKNSDETTISTDATQVPVPAPIEAEVEPIRRQISMTNQDLDDDDDGPTGEGNGGGPPLIEATLVQTEKMQDEEAAVIAHAVKERRICGINVADRGVRIYLALVVAIVVIAAVIVGLVVGKSGAHSTTTIDQGVGLPTISPAPTFVPSSAPTFLSWEVVGHEIEGWGGGRFGTVVSLSSDGKRVAVAYGNEQSECDDFRRRRLLVRGGRRDLLEQGRISARGAAGTKRRAACYAANTAAQVLEFVEDEGEYGEWLPLDEVYADVADVSLSLSGDGERLGVLTAAGAEVYRIAAPGNIPNDGTTSLSRYSLLSTTPDFRQFKIALSNDGTRVAISEKGSSVEDSPTTSSVHIRIFHESTQTDSPSPYFPFDIKQTIEASNSENYISYGDAMTMSDDGSTVAFAASKDWPFEPTGDDYVLVFVYKFSSTSNSWVPNGPGIGLKEAHLLGEESITLSADGSIVAIGTSAWDEQPRACVPGTCADTSGRIRVFQLSDGEDDYTQIGNDIIGETRDLLGTSLALSDDGITLVAGGPRSDGGGKDAGVVKSYHFNGRVWELLGGEEGYYFDGLPGERLGTSVSLSSDGRTLAVGAPYSQTQGVNAGAAVVVELLGLSVSVA